MGPRDHDPVGKYVGPLRRADGEYCYNNYWWPLPEDSYVLREWNYQAANLMRGWDFRISLIPLNNGAWLNEGHTYSPQFESRAAALADAVAKHRKFIAARVFGQPTAYDRRWPMECYGLVNAWLNHALGQASRAA